MVEEVQILAAFFRKNQGRQHQEYADKGREEEPLYTAVEGDSFPASLHLNDLPPACRFTKLFAYWQKSSCSKPSLSFQAH